MVYIQELYLKRRILLYSEQVNKWIKYNQLMMQFLSPYSQLKNLQINNL